MHVEWKKRYHASGPQTSVLEVNGIVMGTVIYHSEGELPWQWQIMWGFRQFNGQADTEKEAKRGVEEKIQRLYEKFSQVWRDAYSTKAAHRGT